MSRKTAGIEARRCAHCGDRLVEIQCPECSAHPASNLECPDCHHALTHWRPTDPFFTGQDTPRRSATQRRDGRMPGGAR